MRASTPIDPQAEKEVAREVREAIIEIQSAAFDKAAAYANVIILAGYAGSFTLWAYTRDQLSPRAMILVALLLGFSLAIFVFFEVFKMVFIHRYITKQAKALYADHPPRVLLERLRTMQSEAPKNLRLHARVGLVMVSSVGTGLAAVGVLFYNLSS